MKMKLVSSLIMAAILPAGVYAAQGNAENGKKVYEKRCAWCHGWEGAGDGPAAERLSPPPRDFTSGMYKIKTTPFDEMMPNDEDIFRMINDGMPDTSMPGWKDILTEQERWDLVAYIKTFAGFEGKPSKQLEYGKQVKSSAESIERGKKLFIDRCSECHGEEGRGDAMKKLKDDLGFRTWPRNLSKPWSFSASNDPKDIYARISVGIPGTQMPNFADPNSKKKMTDEERWDVANYVASLADDSKTVRPENTVVKAQRATGELPAEPTDPKWKEAEPSSFLLVGQIIGEERFFTPSNNSITARAFYNDKEIAILLSLDDRTKSMPGDEKAAEIAEGEVFNDALALQFPVAIPEEMEKPYFGHGDSAKPVNIWLWQSEGKDTPQTVKLLQATGFKNKEERDAAKAGLTAKGVYDKGTWHIVMKRPLVTGEKDKDIQFAEGKFIPMAFAAWDGTNGEKGSKHTMTTWYWILLKPETGMGVYLIPFIVIIVISGAEFLWLRSAQKKK
jgi:DMSO reductase family type II enzyme heme b subunit